MCFGVVTAEGTFSDADLVAFNTFLLVIFQRVERQIYQIILGKHKRLFLKDTFE